MRERAIRKRRQPLLEGGKEGEGEGVREREREREERECA